MEKVSVSDLKVGMIIAEDVKDKNGQLLLPAGLTVVEKHLDVVRSWGIEEVAIESGSKEEEKPLDPQIVARAEKELGELFKFTDRNQPVMGELFQFCVVRRAKQLSSRI